MPDFLQQAAEAVISTGTRPRRHGRDHGRDHGRGPWSASAPVERRGQVPAAERALAIIRFLAQQPWAVTAAAIARELDIPRSSLYHLLDALERQGFVDHISAQRRYQLGVAAVEIGGAFQRQQGLERVARPPIAALALRVGHTCHLGVLDARDVLFLLEESPVELDEQITAAGGRLPAHLSAAGRAILAAEQPQRVVARLGRAPDLGRRTDKGPVSYHQLTAYLRTDKRRRWSEEDGEITPGYASVGAAVRARVGRPVAAVSATFRTDGTDALDTTARAALAEEVLAVADGLTRRLGGRPRAGGPP